MASTGIGRRTSTDGERILLWALPFAVVFWIAAFLAFPGFTEPMSPALTAQEVAAFYRDPDNLPRIRASMIVFNWFGVALIPVLMLIAMQMRRMAHHTPILSYCFIGCIAGGPAMFCIADVFWLLAAFRPERDPALIQLFNDMAWVTFSALVVFLIAQSAFLAVGIYVDRQERPVFPRWLGHFNLAVAAALVPAAFAALYQEGPLAWNGAISFWLKNLAFGLWILVMFWALRGAINRRLSDEGAAA